MVAEFGGLAHGLRHAAVFMALTAVMLRRALPDHAPQLTITYREQLRGVLDIARAEPVLRWRSLIAACGFGSFGAFWTTVTFLLSGPQYGFSQLDIGLFALVGAAGAITSLAGGRVLDKRPRTALAGDRGVARAARRLLHPIGLGGAHLGAVSLVLLIIGVLLMDACVQGAHVMNQSVIYDLLPQARSRLTTVYVTTMFAGRRGRLGGRRPGLRPLGLDRRDPGRGRVPGPRPAVLAGLPAPRSGFLTGTRTTLPFGKIKFMIPNGLAAPTATCLRTRLGSVSVARPASRTIVIASAHEPRRSPSGCYQARGFMPAGMASCH